MGNQTSKQKELDYLGTPTLTGTINVSSNASGSPTAILNVKGNGNGASPLRKHVTTNIAAVASPSPFANSTSEYDRVRRHSFQRPDQRARDDRAR